MTGNNDMVSLYDFMREVGLPEIKESQRPAIEKRLAEHVAELRALNLPYTKKEMAAASLKEFRTEAGLQVEDLSRLARVSPRTISVLENGERTFAPRTISKIIHALNKARKERCLTPVEI